MNNSAQHQAIGDVEPVVRELTNITKRLLDDVAGITDEAAKATDTAARMRDVAEQQGVGQLTSDLDSVVSELGTINRELESLKGSFEDVDSFATGSIDDAMDNVRVHGCTGGCGPPLTRPMCGAGDPWRARPVPLV